MSSKKYCRLCKKKETQSECSYGSKMWSKYAVDDATDGERSAAASAAETEADGGGDGGDGGVGEGFVNGIYDLSYVSEEGLRDWFGKSKSKDGKSGWVNVVTGGTCASDEPGEGTPKCVSSAKRASMTKAERKSAAKRKKAADPGQQSKSGAAKPTYVSTDPKKKMKKEEVEVNEAADKKGKSSGKKDACYHKVKSRYSVWPSAYASGALVKCRKKGAANWGNSDKKEEFQGFTEAQIAALEAAGAIEVNEAGQKCWKGYEKKGTKKMFGKTYNNCVKKEEIELTDAYGETFAVIDDIIKPEPIKAVKSSAEYDVYDIDQIIEPAVTEATRMPAKTGNVYLVMFSFRGKLMSLKLFFPDMKKPSRKEVEYALQGAYPSAMVRHYYETPYQAGESYYQAAMGESTVPGKPAEKLGAVTAIPKDDQDAAKARILAKTKAKREKMKEDWQKSNRKDGVDGMSQKSVNAYKRENPGSKLKTAVTGDVKKGSKSAKRRSSYCSRSKGQQDMHNIDCSKTPDKAICKARRRWKC
jgi:hypothetical protein